MGQELKQLISDERRLDMLTGALEGGSNYWYFISNKMCDKIFAHTIELHGQPFVDRMWKYLKDGHFVNVRDLEDIPTVLGSLKYSTMTEREYLMLDKFPNHFADILAEKDDAVTADVWFQMVLMKNVVYG